MYYAWRSFYIGYKVESLIQIPNFGCKLVIFSLKTNVFMNDSNV